MPVAQRHLRSTTEPETTNAEMTNAFVRLVSQVIEQKRIVARIVALSFVLITIVIFLVPSDYESTVRLMPPDKQQGGAGMAAMLATAGAEGAAASPALGGLLADTLGLKSSGALYVGVLKSATVQDAVIDRFDLRRVYGKQYRIDARKRLAENTEISEDRKSGIITITVTDHSRERVVQLAKAYAETLNQLTAQLNSSGAHREKLFIEDRLNGVKQDLEKAEKDLSEFSSKNLTLDVKEQGKAMVAGLATLQGELIAAESQLSGLEQIYTRSNVRVRSLRARVDLLKQRIAQYRGNQAAPSGNDANAEDIGISVSQLPVLGVTYYDLYRRAKLQETVFEVLTKQYELVKVEEAKELPTIKVLDNPQLPEKSSGPPRIRIILIGTVLAFFGAVSWIWIKDRWHRLDLDDPRKATILELNAIVSVAMQPTLERWRIFIQRIRKRDPSVEDETKVSQN